MGKSTRLNSSLGKKQNESALKQQSIFIDARL